MFRSPTLLLCFLSPHERHEKETYTYCTRSYLGKVYFRLGERFVIVFDAACITAIHNEYLGQAVFKPIFTIDRVWKCVITLVSLGIIKRYVTSTNSLFENVSELLPPTEKNWATRSFVLFQSSNPQKAADLLTERLKIFLIWEKVVTKSSYVQGSLKLDLIL